MSVNTSLREFHDSDPIFNLGRASDDDLIAVKREGDAILVYPGPVRLTLAEWASAVAFTTPGGDTAETFAKALALIEGRDG